MTGVQTCALPISWSMARGVSIMSMRAAASLADSSPARISVGACLPTSAPVNAWRLLAMYATQSAKVRSAAPSAGAVPPPMPTSTVVGYFVGAGGKQTGPFDLGTIRAKVTDGSMTRQTLVWKPGMAGWVAAEGVEELQSLFAAMPPPLPT